MVRSRSASLSSGLESEYDAGRSPSPSPSRSPSPSASPSRSRSRSSSPRTRSRTKQESEPASPKRVDYKRYAHLLSSLAQREAEELAPRLAGAGVWSPRFWSQAAPSAPRWVTASTPQTAADEEEGEGEDELDPELEEEEEEIFSDAHDVDAEDVPRKYLRRRRNRRAYTGPNLAELTASSIVDPATRWPLHPTELEGISCLPTLSAIRDTAERQVRRHDLCLPPSKPSQINARRARRIEAREKEREQRRRVPLRPPEKDIFSPALDVDEVLDVDVDDDIGFAADPERDNYVPSSFAPRVAAALDRTLATLVAFRPKTTSNNRGEGGLDWRSVLSAAAMSVDRSVVEKTEERLRAIFAPSEGETPGTPFDPGSARAYTSRSQPPDETLTLRARLDLVDEAGGPPRIPARDLAQELYAMPPLRTVRAVKTSKRGVYPRSEKDAAERAAVAERHAAFLEEAAKRKAEREELNAVKREQKKMKKEVKLAKARVRAAASRASRRKSEAADGQEA